MIQAVEFLGALLILVAFALVSAGKWQPKSDPYQFTNLIGASILAAIAGYEYQWGFWLLNVVWAGIAAYRLLADPHERTNADL